MFGEMQIEFVAVKGLLRRPGVIEAHFNNDLNIITGRNGAGKTSLLKLIWYIMSGNILTALREVPFDYIEIRTSLYDVRVDRLGSVTCKVTLTIDGETTVYMGDTDQDEFPFVAAEDAAGPEISALGSSVFFPTFRRIEGGFTLSRPRRRGLNPHSANSRPKSEIEESLLALSRTISNNKHTFVAAISTGDIVTLLLNKYSDLSGEYNAIQQNISEDVINSIKRYKHRGSADAELAAANSTLDEVRQKIEWLEAQREAVMLPLERVREVVEKLFKHVGISIGSRISFGDAANAVASDQLSAGEKQMLSFICYNAFNLESVMFIDEPELSLHVDWQRQLFPILLSQKSSNQFIIATHSPFIYSKYSDKEIQITSDRGDELE